MRRMRHTFLAIFVSLPIVGCSALGSTGAADIEGCTVALVAAGSFDPAALLGVAALNSSCHALASDVLQALVKSVANGQSAALRAGRRS